MTDTPATPTTEVERRGKVLEHMTGRPDDGSYEWKPMTVRDLMVALIDLPLSYDWQPKNEAVVQVTVDDEQFFAIESVDEWHDGGIVVRLAPWPLQSGEL